MSKSNKILVVRNDKIGDFVLALPAIRAIKKAFPSSTVTVLVPNYTKEIALSFSWIDDVIIDTKDKKNRKDLLSLLKRRNFDAVICLFSDSYNATLVRQSNIPIRVAPATKWVQFLYTHTLKQRRSKSLKPEYEYNLDLANYFIRILGEEPSSDADTNTEKLFFYSEELRSKQVLKLAETGVRPDRDLCFIHPVTGGSSNTLSLNQWESLIHFLDKLGSFQFIITAGPGESEISQSLVDKVSEKVMVCLYDRNDGIADFMCSVSTASLFIAGSTGPLHLAGAIDVPTIGFYPKKRSSTPLRWKTLNTSGRWIGLFPNQHEDELTDIDITQRFDDIEAWYKKLIRKM